MTRVTNTTNTINMSDAKQYEKSLLKDLKLSNVTTSPGCNDSSSALFADIVSKYDENEGYYKIPNPGWIVINLDAAKEISYLRFLLWDNRGSEGKRQPSNRKYTYRLLIEEDGNVTSKEKESIVISFKHLLKKIISWLRSLLSFSGDYKGESHAASVSASSAVGVVWTAIYENTLNPTNGWQEFYFEDGARKIKKIKIQFFQNTSASTTHKNCTQLVSVQAYAQPTDAIKQLLSLDQKEGIPSSSAPLPNLGFIRNRVIIGGEQEVMNNLVEDEIMDKVATYIKKAEQNYPDLKRLRVDLQENSRNTIKTDIEKQIHIFNQSILKPIEAFDKMLSERFKFYTIVAIALSVFGIAKEILDIVTLTNGKTNPLTISYWLDLIFRSNT